jgi:SAM-dependent methyltransferase
LSYSYHITESELARYRAMSARALKSEAGLWRRAGIGPGAAVVDLGCGPGTFLPLLAERTAPGGTVTGVDLAAEAIAAAQAVAGRCGAGSKITVVQAAAHDTGLPDGSADVVMIRNVLVHNGSQAGLILAHIRALLGSRGRLLAVEPDVAGIVFPAADSADAALEQAWCAMARAEGNDPALGRGDTLASLLRAHGFTITASEHRLDVLRVERSPAWTARERIVSAGHAGQEQVREWTAAIDARVAASGPMRCELPVTAVAATPAPRQYAHGMSPR